MPPLSAQIRETTLHAFTGTDGATPNAGLVLGPDGTFYGTTHDGGANNQLGTVFKVTSGLAFTSLYSFSGPDGSRPYAGLTWGGDGNLYGTTYYGGANNAGTVFQITPAGALTSLHSFASSDGSYPVAGLVLGLDGNLYGSTSGGGANGSGTIFRISTGGVFSTVYSFSGPDGAAPYATLTQGTDGNFYGTTNSGGSNLYFGTLFRVTPAGALTTLHNFAFSDGSNPNAPLTQDSNGNLYGAASNGGANIQHGALFQITPQGTFSVLHHFAGLDGSAPEGPVILGGDGAYYGTSVSGGANAFYGTVFKVTPAGAFTSLYSFNRTDASSPTAGLIVASDGNFYGTASSGGANGYGTVFKIVACLTCTTTTLTSSASPIVYGSALTLSAIVNPVSGSGTPGGSVVFSDGGTPLSTVAVTSGAAALTTASLSPGSHTITAAYGGDGNFQPSSGSVSVNVTQNSSSVTLTSSANPATYGQPVTISVQITPPAATGSVIFAEGGKTLGVATLASGVASFTTSSLGGGSHSVLATYSGDGNFQTSSATFAEVINPAGTTLSLAASANPATVNQQVTLTATVTSPAAGGPTGTVTFLNGGTPLASPVPTVSGQASLAAAFPSSGSLTIQAVYSGDANYLTSSAQITESVTAAASLPALTTLLSFSGSNGSNPSGGLTLGADGLFYGATQSGGANGAGSVFKMTPAGSLITLYSFSGADGASPNAALTLGSDGTVYGTTSGGGASGIGTVFAMPPSGPLAILHNFTGPDGSAPAAGLTFGSDGNLYGTTAQGGASGNGTFFQITPAGTFVTLYSFAATDGAGPQAALTPGADGNFYGSTVSGGLNQAGTLFRITPAGILTPLYSFQGGDGSAPYGALTQTSDGSFYGSTSSGGKNADGTIFKLAPDGTFTTLYDFSGSDGARPESALALNPDGNFYGTTFSGGANSSYGTIFKITPAGALTPLYSFAGPDGSNPAAGLTTGPDGNLYGTTTSGGASGFGSAFRIVVCPACTKTSIITSGTPAAYGATVVLTASVVPLSGAGSPTGTVVFTDSGNALGSAVVNGGVASLSTAVLGPGTHTLQGAYSGDATFQPSVGTVLQAISQAPSTVTLTSSVNPSAYGQPVTFTAAVTQVPGAPSATGTMTFSDGSTALGTVALVTGSASFTTATLAAGTHAISAAYSGDTNYQTATAGLSQSVNLGTVSTKLTPSSNPSKYGQPVTFVATVAPVTGTGVATGAVTFTDGGSTLGVVTLTAGSASFTAPSLNVGIHPIAVTYSGDANFQPANGTLSQTVNSATTSTTVKSSLNPSVYNQPLTFVATVTPATATGSVTFTAGTATIGVVALGGGSASITVPALSAGTQTVSAVYGGSSTFQASSGSVSQAVTLSPTTVTIASSLNPASINQSVAFTATVAGQYAGTPTGSITFFKNGAALGSPVPVSAGSAKLTTSFATAGTLPISASYSGDPNFLSGSAPALNETVKGISTATSLKSSASTSLAGAQVQFTATVTPSSGSIPNGEQVTFASGSVVLGKAATSNGVATLSTTALPAGTDSVTASYPGDSTYAASTSPALQQQVNRNATATTVTSSLNPSVYGTTVVFTAKVTSAGPTPTGTIVWKYGTTTEATVALAAGAATLSTATLPGGTAAMSAVYSGDSVSATSTSATFNQVVNPVATTTALASSVNPSKKGSAVTLTATVSAAGKAAAGSVTFFQGSTTLGTVTLASGKAAITTSTLPSGADTITAKFNANASYSASSASLTQTVN